MKEVIIKPEMVSAAQIRLKDVTRKIKKHPLNKSRFGSEPRRTLAGYIGEMLAMENFKIKDYADTFEYDFLSNKGNKLEIKTVTCKSKPKLDYLCTVNHWNENIEHKQNADYYVFYRILNNYSKGWLLGYIKCNDFFRLGKFVPKGTNFGKFKFEKANATVLPISNLIEIR